MEEKRKFFFAKDIVKASFANALGPGNYDTQHGTWAFKSRSNSSNSGTRFGQNIIGVNFHSTLSLKDLGI